VNLDPTMDIFRTFQSNVGQGSSRLWKTIIAIGCMS